MPRHVRFTKMSTSLPALRPSDAGRLAPYAVSLTADNQRAGEEARVRVKMAERQRRRDAKAREALRKQVVQMALEEARELEQPREVAAVLEQQKRYLAAVGAQHADDRHAHMRSRLYQRFYEPTPFEVAEREENWQRRRAEHRLQRDARLSQIHVRAAMPCAIRSYAPYSLPPLRIFCFYYFSSSTLVLAGRREFARLHAGGGVAEALVWREGEGWRTIESHFELCVRPSTRRPRRIADARRPHP